MRRIALEFLRELREIGRRHGQIAETDVGEALWEAIMDGFVVRRGDFRLPQSFEMLSKRGDALVRGAVGRFLDAASEEAERLGCSEPRDRLLLLRRPEVPRPERSGSYDDFLGGLDLSHATPDGPAWSACNDPASMLYALRRTCRVRKLRLFAAACCRRLWHRLGDESRRAIEVLEQYADRGGTVEGLALAIREAQDAADKRRDQDDRHAANAVAMALSLAQEEEPMSGSQADFTLKFSVTIGVASLAARAPGDAAYGDDEGADMGWVSAVKSEEGAQADLLRDIFGNPFRPVTIDPMWLTPDVLALARRIYDERLIGQMQVLGDRLAGAGCDDPALLDHCLSPTEHVRGCWVVDLLLGRP